MTMPPTTEQVAAYIETGRALADAIKELGSVPSGHLYARLTGMMSLTTYQGFLRILEDGGVIKVENHLITWIGGN